ncbi:MerR family transcriptional regulator [Microbacterium sp.]|uniref:transcriptional regulator FtsR n=1 Tax=Microbacterium sp. TaxID=51671 RepID=UPI003A846C8E
MTPAASPRRRSSSSGYLSIGQVLARLTPEFPSLTSSKLRFLEVQGIVTPMRTESGYRKFSPTDLARVRTALMLQRDHYLPLARIREYLDEHGPDGASAAVVPMSIVPVGRRYRRAELVQAAQANTALLADAVSAGLLPAADTYDQRSLAMLRSLVALETHGIQPRHLRGVRQAVERELSLIESALAPLLRRTDTGSRERAGETAAELSRRMDELRAGLIQTALERLTR